MKPAPIRKIIALAVMVLLAAPGAGRAQEGFESAEILFTRAVLAYDEGKYAEATRDLLKAHELDPGHIDAIYYLGLSYNAQGNFEEAARYLQKGLALDPKNSDLRYELGISLYGRNRFDDALKVFLAIYQVEPQKDNVGYYIGLCYYQKKDYENAATYFRRNVSTATSTRQLNLQYLGLALQALGREAEAAEEWEESIKIEPASPYAARAQQLLTAHRERTGQKRLRLEVTFNAHHDSNPGGEPHGDKSYGNLLNARAAYSVYRADPWESEVTYSFLQTVNYEAHVFDLHNHLIGANLRYKTMFAGMRSIAGIQLNNDILLLGGELYLQRPTATLSLTVQEDTSNFTTMLFRPQYKDFLQRGSTEKRNGANELLGLEHYIRFSGIGLGGGRHQINFGYHFDNEDARRRAWRYAGHKAVAGLLLGLPWDLFAAANFEYHVRFYDKQVRTTDRRDREATLLVAVSRDLTSNLTATLQHFWDRNYSSIGGFRTRRNVAALGLTWRY